MTLELTRLHCIVFYDVFMSMCMCVSERVYVCVYVFASTGSRELEYCTIYPECKLVFAILMFYPRGVFIMMDQQSKYE